MVEPPRHRKITPAGVVSVPLSSGNFPVSGEPGHRRPREAALATGRSAEAATTWTGTAARASLALTLNLRAWFWVPWQWLDVLHAEPPPGPIVCTRQPGRGEV